MRVFGSLVVPCWRGCGARVAMGDAQLTHERVCPLGLAPLLAKYGPDARECPRCCNEISDRRDVVCGTCGSPLAAPQPDDNAQAGER